MCEVYYRLIERSEIEISKMSIKESIECRIQLITIFSIIFTEKEEKRQKRKEGKEKRQKREKEEER